MSSEREYLKSVSKHTLGMSKVIMTPINTRVFNELIEDYKPTQSTSTTKITVVNADTLEAARQMLPETTMVLNMASDTTPGGGFLTGGIAQEETLMRLTDAYRHLNQDRVRYPLHVNEVVYCPGITVLKRIDPDSGRFQILEESERFEVNMLACAAIRMKRGVAVDKSIMTRKIRMILQTAAMMEQKNLVLGALGCGAFNNPPHIVADIFCRMIRDEYDGVFDRICFAILVDTTNDERDMTNLLAFKNVFSSSS